MSTHIDEPIAEASDYVLRATLVGPDGITPIEPDVVSEILYSVRDVATGTMIKTDEDCTSGLSAGGAFALDLDVDDTGVLGTGEMELRLVTFKITHSAGRKRNQEVTYYVDNMQDVPTAP